MTKRILTLAGLAGLLALNQPAFSQQVSWRYYGGVPVTHDVAKKTIELFDRISERTNGEFEIRYIFYGETPYKSTDALKILREGQVQATEWLPSWDSGTYPILAVFELPFLMPEAGSAKDLQTIHDTAWATPSVAKAVDEILSLNGGRLLANMYFEPRNIWTTVPMQSIDEVKGKRIQTTTPDVSEMMLRLGATPSSVVTQDLYQALQRNALDGVLGGVGLIGGSKLNEVLTAGYIINISAAMTSVLISDAEFQKLSPEFQQILLEEGDRFREEFREIMPNSHNTKVAALKDSGTFTINEVTPEEYKKLREVAKTHVWPAWAARYGEGGEAIVQEILDTVPGGNQ